MRYVYAHTGSLSTFISKFYHFSFLSIELTNLKYVVNLNSNVPIEFEEYKQKAVAKKTICTPELGKYIVNMVYRKHVKNPELLNRNKAFSKETYGETSLELIDDFFKGLKPDTNNSQFLDLGSGILET